MIIIIMLTNVFSYDCFCE